MKKYEPIQEFEQQTSYCPLYLAWIVVDEVRDYARVPVAEGYADKLARRAEIVFAKNPFWQRKYQSAHGRGYILSSMRHWLAGVLAKENPALFRQLPESFKLGQPLPAASLRSGEAGERRLPTGHSAPAPALSHFVHGCELLPV